MDKEAAVRENALAMIHENGFCVLSTCHEDQPNASLMQYLASESGHELYMLTMRNSVKHANIRANPRVSLLIDNRAAIDGRDRPICALTVYGSASMIDDPHEAGRRISELVACHPGLVSLADDPGCAVILIRAERFLLLDSISGGSRLAF